MKVKKFIKKFVEPNTLIRLWVKSGLDYSEVIKDDKPMMEHELIESKSVSYTHL